MRTDTNTDLPIGAEPMHGSWAAGAVGGIVGAIGFGLVMLGLMDDPVLDVAIPNMYLIEATPSVPALVVGLAFHLFHGAVIGLGFAGLLQVPAVQRFAAEPARLGALALYYGLLVWLVLGAFVMPLWLRTVGFAAARALPDFSPGASSDTCCTAACSASSTAG